MFIRRQKIEFYSLQFLHFNINVNFYLATSLWSEFDTSAKFKLNYRISKVWNIIRIMWALNKFIGDKFYCESALKYFYGEFLQIWPKSHCITLRAVFFMKFSIFTEKFLPFILRATPIFVVISFIYRFHKDANHFMLSISKSTNITTLILL